MSQKIQLNKLQQITNDEVRAISILNDNFKAIENKIDGLLSRTKERPNQMETELDLDLHKIINVASGTDDNDVVIRKDLRPVLDEAHQVLERTSRVLERVNDRVIEADNNVQLSGANAERSRIWADGNDEEVKGLGGTHSSMVSSGLAYAYANAPEDTPVEEWATSHSLIVQGEKGDKGESAMINGYDVLFIEGGDGITVEQEMDTLTIKSDVSKAYVDEQIGNISAVLDTINGEVI